MTFYFTYTLSPLRIVFMNERMQLGLKKYLKRVSNKPLSFWFCPELGVFWIDPKDTTEPAHLNKVLKKHAEPEMPHLKNIYSGKISLEGSVYQLRVKNASTKIHRLNKELKILTKEINGLRSLKKFEITVAA
jgi:hypothetical protein